MHEYRPDVIYFVSGESIVSAVDPTRITSWLALRHYTWPRLTVPSCKKATPRASSMEPSRPGLTVSLLLNPMTPKPEWLMTPEPTTPPPEASEPPLPRTPLQGKDLTHDQQI